MYLDTNVFLDHLLKRDDVSSEVLNLCETRKINGFASSASMFTIAYVLERWKKDPKELLQEFAEFIEFIPTYKQNLLSGLRSDFEDFEDAFQYKTALNEPELQFFITKNLKDYRIQTVELPVISPSSLLIKINEK